MKLSKEDFEPLVGDEFEVPHPETGEVYTCLTLGSLTPLRHPHPGRAEPFSLIWHGPADRAIGQGMFLMRHASLGEHQIFLVPVGQKDGVREYESIFN